MAAKNILNMKQAEIELVVRTLQAYRHADAQTLDGIKRMLSIIDHDPEDNTREAAKHTIIEALFPTTGSDGQPGIPLSDPQSDPSIPNHEQLCELLRRLEVRVNLGAAGEALTDLFEDDAETIEHTVQRIVDLAT